MLTTEQKEQVKQLLKSGENLAAKGMLEKAIKEQANDFDAQWLLAEANFLSGDYQDAYRIASKILQGTSSKLPPSDKIVAMSYWILVKIFYHSSDYNYLLKAIDDLEKHVPEHKRKSTDLVPWADFYLLKSEFLMEKYDNPEAITVIDKGIQLDPSKPALYFARAKAQVKINSKNFLDAYEEDITKAKKMEASSNNHGSFGGYEKSIPFNMTEITQDFEQRIAGQDLTAFLGALKRRRRFTDEGAEIPEKEVSIDMIKAFLQIDPATVYIMIASFFLKNNAQFAKAQEWASAVIDFDKNNFEAHQILAEVKFRQKDFDGAVKAIEELEKTANTLPKSAAHDYVYGVVLRFMLMQADAYIAMNALSSAVDMLVKFCDQKPKETKERSLMNASLNSSLSNFSFWAKKAGIEFKAQKYTIAYWSAGAALKMAEKGETAQVKRCQEIQTKSACLHDYRSGQLYDGAMHQIWFRMGEKERKQIEAQPELTFDPLAPTC